MSEYHILLSSRSLKSHYSATLTWQVRWEKAARVAQRRDRDKDFVGYTYKRRVQKDRGQLGGDLFAAPRPEGAQEAASQGQEQTMGSMP